MKEIFFIIALLNFTYILSTQDLINTEEEYDDEYVIDGRVDCESEDVDFVKFPTDVDHNTTSYDYCRSLYFDKEKYYRCCYAKTSNKTYGCVLTNYSDFASEDSIKEYINGFDDAEIDCEAKYIGVSILVLFLALF